MRRTTLACCVIAGLLLTASARPASARVGVSIGFFYGELAPYGRWVECPYGEAWVPAVAVGWQPYSNGEWIYTDYGWTWVSYDPWGGDPFHYGAWTWEDPYGWMWVPGTVWAPAWVTWCDSDDFIGWAPLGPTFDLTFAGYLGSPVVASRASYVFVPAGRFAGASVASVRLAAGHNAALLRRGRSLTGFRVSGGVVRNTALPFDRVQAAMGGRLARRPISAARTDPRPFPTAGVRRVALTAPAASVRAAFAGRDVVRRTQVRAPGRVRPSPARAHPGMPANAGRPGMAVRRTTVRPRTYAAPARRNAPPPRTAVVRRAPVRARAATRPALIRRAPARSAPAPRPAAVRGAPVRAPAPPRLRAAPPHRAAPSNSRRPPARPERPGSGGG